MTQTPPTTISPDAVLETILKEHISNFRAAVAEPNARERYRVSDLDDFFAPCQLHLFWFTAKPDLDYSLLVRTRLANAEDGLVKVVGPIELSRKTPTLLKAVEDSIWDEQIKDTSGLLRPVDNSYRRSLAADLASALESLDRYIVQRAHSESPQVTRIGSKQLFHRNGFTWEIYGDPLALVRLPVPSKRVKKSTRTRKPVATQETGVRETPPRREQPGLDCFVTWFYPEIWIGDRPFPTVEEILRRQVPLAASFAPPALDAQLDGRKIVVHSDGMIGVESEDRGTALETLNLIMAAAALLSDLETRALRESELGRGTIDTDASEIVSWGVSWGTEEESLRTASKFRFDPSNFDVDMMLSTRQNVTVDQLRSILALSNTLSADPYLGTVSQLLLEAHTHVQESAYRQGMLMAWIVIESWIANEWSEIVERFGTSAKHRNRLEDTRSWTASVQADTLHLMGVIDSSELSRITVFRNRRNQVIHKSYNPSRSEAEDILQFAERLVKRAL